MFSATDAARGPWPSVTYETLPWSFRTDQRISSRTQQRRHQGPYQAAIPASIRDQELKLPADVLATAEDAAAAIVRFDADVGDEIAPFSAVLLRSESAASSRIENLTASARAIAEAEIGVGSRRNATQIVGNSRAMSAAIRLADHLDGAAILAMHHALLEDAEPDMAGRWRAQQVWIGGSHIGPHDAMFVPPRAARLEKAIDDLIAFACRDDMPVLPQVAVTHAQFETLHPFPDGNGRTGRAILHSMLRSKGLTRQATVPISAGLLVDTERYFAALDAYREGDAAPIVEQVAAATFRALTNGRELVAELRAIRTRWGATVGARSGSATWRIADLLIQRPVINARVITEELGIRPTNVYRALNPLLEGGVLVETTDRSRDRIWRSAEVLRALDAFAARAGRRDSL